MSGLTEQEIEIAIGRKRTGSSLAAIAHDLGCSRRTLCRALHDAGVMSIKSHADARPSASELMERVREIPLDTRDLTAKVFGDPLPGRSALDRREARG